mmetsp:Transcript_21843/g.46132  ORF Transcript_21843/g.46132 Transcript_21843/m.46132 type:complete len:411 (-) Transcript_21843:254-1486(-)
MSGPEMNCPGYESNLEMKCTTNAAVLGRVDSVLLEQRSISTKKAGWCHEQCQDATLDWDLPISSFALGICIIIVASMPLFIRLKEDKSEAEPRDEFLLRFWDQLQRRATWQIILYGVISHITFGVHNAAKPNANYKWLGLTTFQEQIMIIFEKLAFCVGIAFFRKYALNVSWRKIVIMGSLIVVIFNSLYFLIIFDIWRNTWFYMFTDVSTSFMHTLNILVSWAVMVEVAERGYEAITYAMLTAASNCVIPLSAVVSYQLLAFFPLLTEQDSIAADTPQVRKEFAILQSLVIVLNLTSLLALPLLPRQKKETREIVSMGEKSPTCGKYVIYSLISFLCYSSIVTFVTVKYHDSYGCLKIFGGRGCTEHESSIPALFLVSSILAFCYGTNFFLSYWPILNGESEFSWTMFV